MGAKVLGMGRLVTTTPGGAVVGGGVVVIGHAEWDAMWRLVSSQWAFEKSHLSK